MKLYKLEDIFFIFNTKTKKIHIEELCNNNIERTLKTALSEVLYHFLSIPTKSQNHYVWEMCHKNQRQNDPIFMKALLERFSLETL